MTGVPDPGPVPSPSATRRAVVGGGLAVAVSTVLTACAAEPRPTQPDRADPTPATEDEMSPETIAYGPDPQQFGELTRPVGESRGTVVVVHGGFWQSRYGLEYGRDIAADLGARGWTVWNIEYRRVGSGGGWPGTFDDVAAAVDHLAELDVDTDTLVAVGHSAGGHLAVWAAGRAALPEGAPGHDPRVVLTGVVAQAGVLDLATAQRTGVGSGAVEDLLGGTAEEQPERYRVADPIAVVPLGVPVLCVHSATDALVPISQSRAYVEAARAAGARAELVEVAGDHFAVIDPTSPAWAEGRFVAQVAG